jgi:hypothetical protein
MSWTQNTQKGAAAAHIAVALTYSSSVLTPQNAIPLTRMLKWVWSKSTGPSDV